MAYSTFHPGKVPHVLRAIILFISEIKMFCLSQLASWGLCEPPKDGGKISLLGIRAIILPLFIKKIGARILCAVQEFSLV